MSDSSEQSQRDRSSRNPRAEYEPSRDDLRRTERLAPTGSDWSNQEPINPGWRQERATSRGRRRRAGAIPTSPQEFQIWLQQGGWRYVAIIAALFVLALIVTLWFNQNARSSANRTNVVATTTTRTERTALPQQATVTVAPTAPAAAPAQFFVVSGTGELGLFLRADSSPSSEVLETLPEGTRVEQIGDDATEPDRVWRKVRTPGGREGWVAVDFLQPAP